ncbi:hypothetical protein PsorP6_003014 [Peronosclerospora sorghi]|uniref:Uncharacterized protein n=1 Tax=Peronosclerospora sorghi TaxID=230839 RepID=A0ACC0VQ69_9STRA|nr:hypothetical protein PsorP6_003014 [Peronosclerospora sorghi]
MANHIFSHDLFRVKTKKLEPPLSACIMAQSASTDDARRELWRYLTSKINATLSEKDGEVVSIRRRFYSSDIVLQGGCRGILTSFNRRVEHERCSSIHEQNVTFELAVQWDALDVRYRTCSETFPTSSRVRSSLLHTFHRVSGHRSERQDAQSRNETQEHQSIDRDGVKHLLQEVPEMHRTEDARASLVVGDDLVIAETEGHKLEQLRNLHKLFQEGFLTVTDYRSRRLQLVDALSNGDQTMPHTPLDDMVSNKVPIVYRDPPDFSTLRERDAIKHVFNSAQCTWTSSRIQVKIEATPFAKGGLRQVFHLQDLSMLARATRDETDGTRASYVAKIALDPHEHLDTYFKDVEMQAVAAKYATLYNSYHPPRRVEFLEACILQLLPRGRGHDGIASSSSSCGPLRGTICGVEPFIAGEYHKHNNNCGYVSDLERNTPQTFSHFTYEASGHELLVVDIQGVGDHYTDPQIHTRRGKEFGKGNLALRGIERFLASHRCNAICRYLKLPLINPKDEGKRVHGTVPSERYMQQPRIAIDQVDTVLCHYYSDFEPWKKYKKRMRKKRAKQLRTGSRRLERVQARDHRVRVDASTQDRAGRHSSSRFRDALLGDQHRACSSFACVGVMQCIVS